MSSVGGVCTLNGIAQCVDAVATIYYQSNQNLGRELQLESRGCVTSWAEAQMRSYTTVATYLDSSSCQRLWHENHKPPRPQTQLSTSSSGWQRSRATYLSFPLNQPSRRLVWGKSATKCRSQPKNIASTDRLQLPPVQRESRMKSRIRNPLHAKSIGMCIN